MQRGQTVVVKSNDGVFYNMIGVVAGFNPLYKFSVRVKFDQPPYNIAHGYWFQESQLIVIRDNKKK